MKFLQSFIKVHRKKLFLGVLFCVMTFGILKVFKPRDTN